MSKEKALSIAGDNERIFDLEPGLRGESGVEGVVEMGLDWELLVLLEVALRSRVLYFFEKRIGYLYVASEVFKVDGWCSKFYLAFLVVSENSSVWDVRGAVRHFKEVVELNEFTLSYPDTETLIPW